MKNKVLIMLMGFFLFAHQLFAQDVSVSGNVKDEKGEALIGVSIQIKGTPTGNITDIDGNFTLSSVPANGELVFSYMGYQTQTIPVKGKSVINVVLKEDSQALDEVVIVGFGTQKKVNLTGAVASVGAEVLENKPVANIGQALQGVVPNLNVSATNSSPNATPSFNVRGGTSIGLDSDGKKYEVKNGSPLIIVDGIQVDADYLNMMNPSDIENISVLKDASASAIYGARATYGVMLITTKSGKNDSKASVTYNMNLQWNTPSHIPDILDAYTIQLAKNREAEMTGGTVTPWMETLLAAKKKYMEDPRSENAWIYNEGSTTNMTWVANMNPYEVGVKDWTPLQRHNISISGGSAKTRYYISLGYQRQEGMYTINTDVQNRYNINMNLNTNITKWLDVATKISYNTSNYNEPYMNAQKGSVWSAMKNDPGRNVNMPIKTGANDPIPDAWTDNILGWLAYGATQSTKNTNTVFNITPTITICPELNVKAELSYRPTEYFQKRVIPTRNYVVDNWNSTINSHTYPSTVREETRHSDYYTINAYANFNKAFGNHNISAVAGFNQEWYYYRKLYGEAEDILTNDLPTLGMTTGSQYTGDNEEHWAIRGAFLRANYDYAGRYLFEFSGRYDGTSRFGHDTRYQFFPSFSAGWRISEEKFMANTRSWLDNLKIRGSWGSLGNQDVSNYAYIASYGAADYISWVMNNEQIKGMNPTAIIASDLTWETASTLDFGVDVTTLNGRLDATFDWYTRRTTDILMDGTKLPAVLGASVPKRNSGELKTNGWELSVKWKDQLSNGIRYDIGLVLSDYQSEVVKFTGNPNSLLSSLYDGMKMGEIWGYETVGILQESDFTVDENGKKVLIGPDQSKVQTTLYPGDVRYADLNNDGEISNGDNTLENPGDRKIIGNSTPRFQYGITGNISWKNFDLNIFFQGVGKKDVWISDNVFWGGDTAGNWEMYNNSWTPEHTDAKYPMYAGRISSITQSGYLFNAAYLRLKTLALGYTLPKAWVSKAKLSNVRLSLSGYNLFEITQIPNLYDPDQISSSYPMMRSVAFGLQVGF
ncbi:TonB-dependent receptor [Parabacteroides sp. BX2]|jgi:TonB-dependent starch-binding outer membrane protein SusC|uniref:TonB-dependent receptor n=1 Tax=Parabacteroides segnis TaxID=2763058 RepID=A0ABR7E7B7_9BACT|nr:MULTISPECIES: TonB-dependent receptor [Parabacteroides]MBC5645661.1 TonB-dependent receptor [Parabacteroides segnis]MCM0712599.1 TonB-dependent receptor [Parabacteroides sp. TA-V-105]